MQLSNKVAQFETDSDIVNAWVHGPEAGVASLITMGLSEVRTPARLIKQFDTVLQNAIDGTFTDINFDFGEIPVVVP